MRRLERIGEVVRDREIKGEEEEVRDQGKKIERDGGRRGQRGPEMERLRGKDRVRRTQRE